MMNSKLFVISGGPGSGKTTLLRELASLGFQHAPEVARRIIQEQVESGGTALPWEDREAYTRLMLHRSIDSFRQHEASEQCVFFDRGIPDTLGYARLIGLRDVSFIQDACRRHRYASPVFLAPPWEEIYSTDDERRQDFAEAERTFYQVKAVYKECGYQTTDIPKAVPSARAKFVLQQINC